MTVDFLKDPVHFIITWLSQLLGGWGLPGGVITFLMSLIGAGAVATGAMLFCILLIWYERKMYGRIQDRLGPNRVGPWGIFQPFADMLKIFAKEYITPRGAEVFTYNLAPILAVAAVLLIWAVIPFYNNVSGVNLNVGALYIIAVGGLGELPSSWRVYLPTINMPSWGLSARLPCCSPTKCPWCWRCLCRCCWRARWA